MRTIAAVALLTVVGLVAGCSHQPRGAPPPATTEGVRPAVDTAPSRSEPTRAAPGEPGVPEPPSARGNMAFYEVFGRRYHTLPTSQGYRERGVASWYGAKFHGLPTSSGEPYDMHAMTAAHKSLPLPTWVEVHNLRNDRRIIVRVNDRGPFVGNRIIDLSYAAARELDMVEAGTALVEVRALHDPAEISAEAIIYTADDKRTTGAQLLATRPSPRRSQGASPVTVATAAVPVSSQVGRDTPGAASSASDDTATGRLFVQVGAFSQRENAQRLNDRLAADGFSNAFIISDTASQPVIHRVRIGPIADVSAYDAAVEELARLGVFETRLVSE